MKVFIAGAISILLRKSHARTTQVSRLSQMPFAIFAKVFAESGAMTSISAQRRRSMCMTGSPTVFHLCHSSSSPAISPNSSCTCWGKLRIKCMEACVETIFTSAKSLSEDASRPNLIVATLPLTPSITLGRRRDSKANLVEVSRLENSLFIVAFMVVRKTMHYFDWFFILLSSNRAFFSLFRRRFSSFSFLKQRSSLDFWSLHTPQNLAYGCSKWHVFKALIGCCTKPTIYNRMGSISMC
mmetsp:Transcript_18570/g.35387  ORF Transcript_18570/g.35387 Transcript_18570/m.35387 type:complete len:240 (+) Transcript_18570:657-1376(+)